MATYRLSGHVLASEICLDEYGPAIVSAEGAADVVLRRAAVALQPALPAHALTHSIDIDGEPFLAVAKLGERRVFRVHGCADFLVDACGSEVVCTPVPGCPEDMLAQLVVDRLLPHVLDLRGVPTLHASAIDMDGVGAVGLVGDPGAGKSTLAGALSPPHRLLCDDCAALRLEASQAWVYPSYPFVRLRKDAAEHLGAATDELRPSPQRTIKWRARRQISSSAVRLARIYALKPGDRGPAIEELSHRDAVVELARHLYRMDPTDRAKLSGEIAMLEQLTRIVPVAWLRLGRALQDLPAVARAVLADASRTATM